jgi:hypothetical protein
VTSVVVDKGEGNDGGDKGGGGGVVRVHATVYKPSGDDNVDGDGDEVGEKVVIECDAVVCTLPLGVLKAGTVAFEPPLPAWKQGKMSAKYRRAHLRDERKRLTRTLTHACTHILTCRPHLSPNRIHAHTHMPSSPLTLSHTRTYSHAVVTSHPIA